MRPSVPLIGQSSRQYAQCGPERAGYVRRNRDDSDRRKVNVEVTPRHYEEAGKVWQPLMEDWQETLASRFTAQELRVITEFLVSATELGAWQMRAALSTAPPGGNGTIRRTKRDG